MSSPHEREALQKALTKLGGVKSPDVTHYRFLGLDDGESDPDAIDGAADRMMAHLKTFTNRERYRLAFPAGCERSGTIRKIP